jgi:Na+/H+ antiporter NhaB
MKLIVVMVVALSVLIACGTCSPSVARPTGQNPFGVMLPSQLIRSPGG